MKVRKLDPVGGPAKNLFLDYADTGLVRPARVGVDGDRIAHHRRVSLAGVRCCMSHHSFFAPNFAPFPRALYTLDARLLFI